MLGRISGRAAGVGGAALVAVGVLAGCSSDSSSPPDYRPSPERTNIEGDPGVQISPIIPVPSLSGGGSGNPGPGAPSSSSGKQPDPQVVATKLRAPVGLALLPDNTALVGERKTGRIVRVQPVAGKPVPTVRTLPGVDGSGDGGLLDLAVSPSYAEDSLIYAYLSTKNDNRVVAFTLKGPVTPVLTGIPHGSKGNSGRIEFTASGLLQIATGDTGRNALAADRSSLAGKVLRVTDIGSAAPGNPGSSPVYARGVDTAGVCSIPKRDVSFEVEGSSAADVYVVKRGANVDRTAPLTRTPAGTGAPGDCAVQTGRLYVASLGGKQLLSAPISGSSSAPKVGAFTAALKGTYGRLRTVVPAADGALWLTTDNRDRNGKPVAADERVIRYQPQGGGSDANPA